MRRTTPTALKIAAAVVSLGAAGARGAFALDETGDLLLRAREGRPPTPQDRALAHELLAEWQDEAPADVILRAAFERIAKGLPPDGAQLPAIRKLQATYARERRKAVAAEAGGAQAGHDTQAGRKAGGPWRFRYFRYKKHVAVAGIGAAVLAAGVIWLVVARRRSAR